MKKLIDTKSLFIGLLLGVVVTMTIAATSTPAFRSQGPVGRYQITGTETYAFIVDTVTGQAWTSSNYGSYFKTKLKPEK